VCVCVVCVWCVREWPAGKCWFVLITPVSLPLWCVGVRGGVVCRARGVVVVGVVCGVVCVVWVGCGVCVFGVWCVREWPAGKCWFVLITPVSLPLVCMCVWCGLWCGVCVVCVWCVVYVCVVCVWCVVYVCVVCVWWGV